MATPFDHLKGTDFVYFIASGEFIKIGFTRSIGARLQKMFTDIPNPRLLWVEKGSPKQEKVFHRHFAVARERGEWFRKSPELLEFLRERYRVFRPDLSLPPELKLEC